MKETMADMMWDTNVMFNDFRRRFFPDFWNMNLGIFDSPFLRGLEEGRRRHRPRRHRRHREIIHKEPELKTESEMKQEQQQSAQTTESQRGTQSRSGQSMEMGKKPEVEIRTETK